PPVAAAFPHTRSTASVTSRDGKGLTSLPSTPSPNPHPFLVTASPCFHVPAMAEFGCLCGCVLAAFSPSRSLPLSLTLSLSLSLSLSGLLCGGKRQLPVPSLPASGSPRNTGSSERANPWRGRGRRCSWRSSSQRS